MSIVPNRHHVHCPAVRSIGVLLLIALWLCSTTAIARDKTDRLFLANGDRVTGEIIELADGKVRVSTDAMGQVSIDWIEIVGVESDYSFAVELDDGERLFGELARGDAPEVAVLSEQSGQGAGGTRRMAHDRIVRIYPFEDDFWSRLSGSLAFGLNYTKASGTTQFSLDAETTYQTRDSALTFDASAISSRSEEEDSTRRIDLGLQHFLYRGNRWFDVALLSFERNDEFDLDGRFNLGYGRGRYLIQDATSELALFGGVQANIETLAGGVDSQENVEGIVGASYKRYIYSDPSLDLTIGLRAYPNISDPGRQRAEFDARMRYELVNDLFFDLRIYESYDSDPPAGDGAQNDYGVVTSVGWSY